MASLVARWSQALAAEGSWAASDRWAPARLQLYVDDPTAVAWGSPEQRATTFSLIVVLWLVLGIPLSWKKGAIYDGVAPYTWIGVQFSVPSRGVARMALQPASRSSWTSAGRS